MYACVHFLLRSTPLRSASFGRQVELFISRSFSVGRRRDRPVPLLFGLAQKPKYVILQEV